MNTPTNLPISIDSNSAVRSFFEGVYTVPQTFPVEQVDAVSNFFKSRGFNETYANSTTIILLQQAKRDNVDIFTVIDSLKKLSDSQLSSIVSEVLNYNRQKTSVLGYRQKTTSDFHEQRNVRI